MSKGTNGWHGSGNVASEVQYGQTKSGDVACNFKLVIEQAHKALVYLRINVYGGNVEVCRKRNLGIGDYVVIGGELMNREGRAATLTEVRCLSIVITHEDRRHRNGNR